MTGDHELKELREFAMSLDEKIGPMFGRDVVRLVDELEAKRESVEAAWEMHRLASTRLAAAEAALSYVLDEAMENWHLLAPIKRSAHGWLGLTQEQYAMYVENRIADLAAALVSEAAPQRNTT